MSEAIAQAEPTRKRNRPNHLVIGKLESERDQLLEDLSRERAEHQIQVSGMYEEIRAHGHEAINAKARLALCALLSGFISAVATLVAVSSAFVYLGIPG